MIENGAELLILAMQKALDEAKASIKTLEEQRDTKIAILNKTLKEEIAEYEDKLKKFDPSVNTQAEKDSWIESLSSKTNALNTEPTKIRAEYQVGIDKINREMKAFLDTYDEKFAQLSVEFRAEYIRLKNEAQQIGSG